MLAEMAQQAGKSSQKELELYEKGLDRLNSKDNSKRMEDCFENALKSSDDEWGPTGYILNTIKSPPFTNRKRKYSDMASW